jgi:hypothetical protein
MSQNDPYAKLGGGALDQELFTQNRHLEIVSYDITQLYGLFQALL